jgi:hypothetical protein
MAVAIRDIAVGSHEIRYCGYWQRLTVTHKRIEWLKDEYVSSPTNLIQIGHSGIKARNINQFRITFGFAFLSA